MKSRLLKVGKNEYTIESILVQGKTDTKSLKDLQPKSTKLPFLGRNTVLVGRKRNIGDSIKDPPENEVVIKKYARTQSYSGQNETIINKYLKSLTPIPHANIAEFLEYLHDSDEENHCIITKKYSGPDLFDYVTGKQKGLTEVKAFNLFFKILNGVNFLHKNAVAHGDLSAMNILLDGEENIRLIDFEMAKFVPMKPQHNKPMIRLMNGAGTLKYMPPEVFEQRTTLYNPFASDIWSLGVILFFILVGNEIYETPSCEDIRFVYVVNGKLRQILKLWGVHLSEEAVDLLEKTLQYNPENRVTAQDIYHHPWIKKHQPPLQPLQLQHHPSFPLSSALCYQIAANHIPSAICNFNFVVHK